ncbi:predicted protein [Chaetoceros tenuissimus]|uniref:Uncharacterized protein n=1 Tax=Chaetoceros tenuissimus TaxID=426638 RepID=A0AAD3D8N2_9STRA|nr:predicted protein [Chaetoceros tenuissimus]
MREQQQHRVVRLLPFPKPVEHKPCLSPRKRPADQISIPPSYQQPQWSYRTGVDNSYSNFTSSTTHPSMTYPNHWQPHSWLSQPDGHMGQYQANTGTNHIDSFSSTMPLPSLHENTLNTDPSVKAGVAKTVQTAIVRHPIPSDDENKTVASYVSAEDKKASSSNLKRQVETNMTSEQHHGTITTATSSSNSNLENDASNPRESLSDCSVQLSKGVQLSKSTSGVAIEVQPQKPIRFTKANDESGFAEVKKIIRGMLDDGVTKPAKNFRKKHPTLACKYESVSLSVGIACFVRDYKASKATATKKKANAKANNSSDSKMPNVSLGPVDPLSKASQNVLEVGNVDTQTCEEQGVMTDMKHGTTIYSMQYNDAIAPASESSRGILENGTNTFNELSAQIVSKTKAEKPLLIPFTNRDDSAAYIKVKKIIHGMIDNGVSKPAKEFYKNHSAIANKYEKRSLSKAISRFSGEYKDKKAAASSLLSSSNSQVQKTSDEDVIHHSSKETQQSELKQNTTTATSIQSSLCSEVTQTENLMNNQIATQESQQHIQRIGVSTTAEIIHIDGTDDASFQTDQGHSNIEYIEIDATNHSQPKSDLTFCQSLQQTSQTVAKSPFHEKQSKTTFDTHIYAMSLAEWFFVEVVKVNIAGFRPKCKEYADELVKHGFYNKEMVLNFCTIDMIDSDDFKFMLLAHRQCLKKWLLEHRVSK